MPIKTGRMNKNSRTRVRLLNEPSEWRQRIIDRVPDWIAEKLDNNEDLDPDLSRFEYEQKLRIQRAKEKSDRFKIDEIRLKNWEETDRLFTEAGESVHPLPPDLLKHKIERGDYDNPSEYEDLDSASVYADLLQTPYFGQSYSGNQKQKSRIDTILQKKYKKLLVNGPKIELARMAVSNELTRSQAKQLFERYATVLHAYERSIGKTKQSRENYTPKIVERFLKRYDALTTKK